MNRLYFHGWEPDATSEEGVAANGVNGNASSVGKGLRPVPVFSLVKKREGDIRDLQLEFCILVSS